MSYRKYVQDSSVVLSEFSIYKESRYSEYLTTFKACHKLDPSAHFLIKREVFEKSEVSLLRLESVFQAQKHNLLVNSRVFLEESSSSLTIYSIEPLFTSEMEPLSSLMQSNSLSSSQRERVFENLVYSVSALHTMGVAHLELAPYSIMVQHKSSVFFRTFPITTAGRSNLYWYAPPEELSGASYYSGGPQSDIWALGCIYAELFFSLTPLFQALSNNEKILKMFEVLSPPHFSDVGDYMTWENYSELKALASEDFRPQIFGGLPSHVQDILGKVFNFRPEDRPSAKDLVKFNWKAEVQEEIPKPAEVELKKADNTLTVTVILAKNLDCFKDNPGNCLSFGFEINTCGVPQAVSSSLYTAERNFNIHYEEKFYINSDWFKQHYKQKPIMIYVYQNAAHSFRDAADSVFGACEVYIGSLFAPISHYNPDNTVIGYYNIETPGNILGQLKIEVKTRLPLVRSTTVQVAPSLPVDDTNALSDLRSNLNKLNMDLKEKANVKETQIKEDSEFDETLRELRRLLLK